MRKMKVICRQKDGNYMEELFVDGAAQKDAADMETKHAEAFLNAFSPEELTRQCTERYGEDFVLVFRTDEKQMQEFDALLKEHDTSC